ncbi:nicotinate phosphoribosyltransferase [Roseateles chitinivorans]|uniref:Nicotinate phosphoribosyltransferase n=1 Tax=Roseateles chitinivorans TaxID=2917965 RepID=A0A2G9CEA6_9BURK|nr:nicotinate phosphoribosyltransferase [Roseateles chitinivorans]PIM53829.1 nicotinate phosphoribosyltransferase [Roseateles chitinivorans]
MDDAPVIRSLLETDLYKFTMWQTLLHAFPANDAEYRFVCRNVPAFPLSELCEAVNRELDHLCTLGFSDEELTYLGGLRFMKADFIDFLRIFRFQRRFIEARPGEGAEAGQLVIVAKGPQVHVMGFEIFVLAIVNELYFRRLCAGREPEVLAEGRARLAVKAARFRDYAAAVPATLGADAHPFECFDFGLRRRFSGAWHDEVVATLKREIPQVFKGTSNVALARRHGLVPIGTMAHEYLQTWQAVGVQLRLSQRAALEGWVQEFRGDLGIALTDVIGMDAFLADFDLYFAKLFDGLRHDSGDPVAWGEKALAHYAALRIDARTKRLVFSDGLDVDEALRLHTHFAGRVPVGFGIGTHLSNDLGPKPLNIVMKLVRCNDQPVAKLSDAPGKTLCDDQTFLNYLRQVFRVPTAG